MSNVLSVSNKVYADKIADEISDFASKMQYFRPTKDFYFAQIKTLPRNRKSVSFVQLRKKFIAENNFISMIFPFIAIIKAPTKQDRYQVVEDLWSERQFKYDDMLKVSGKTPFLRDGNFEKVRGSYEMCEYLCFKIAEKLENALTKKMINAYAEA